MSRALALVLVAALSPVASAALYHNPPAVYDAVVVTVTQSPPDALDWLYTTIDAGPMRVIDEPMLFAQRRYITAVPGARVELWLDRQGQADLLLNIKANDAEALLDEFGIVVGPQTTGTLPVGSIGIGYTVQIVSSLGTREFFVGAGRSTPEPATWALALPALLLVRRRR